LSAATSSLRADDAELADLLCRGANDLALALSEAEVARLIAYVRLIERWNATYNLTAIRDPREMVVQHLLDCLAAAAALERRRAGGAGERLVDVGSGAGLPGLVIAMMSPAREVTCVDSVGKKAAFITQAVGVLGLKNAHAVHGRIEKLVDRFDIVASRAFASLGELVAATSHLLKDSGTWMAMKGKTPRAELLELGEGFEFHVEPLRVPALAADRCIVWLRRGAEASARS
jgi:16S rRNA (guanine527-N7)-methyltransferase